MNVLEESHATDTVTNLAPYYLLTYPGRTADAKIQFTALGFHHVHKFVYKFTDIQAAHNGSGKLGETHILFLLNPGLVTIEAVGTTLTDIITEPDLGKALRDCFKKDTWRPLQYSVSKGYDPLPAAVVESVLNGVVSFKQQFHKYFQEVDLYGSDFVRFHSVSG